MLTSMTPRRTVMEKVKDLPYCVFQVFFYVCLLCCVVSGPHLFICIYTERRTVKYCHHHTSRCSTTSRIIFMHSDALVYLNGLFVAFFCVSVRKSWWLFLFATTYCICHVWVKRLKLFAHGWFDAVQTQGGWSYHLTLSVVQTIEFGSSATKEHFQHSYGGGKPY